MRLHLLVLAAATVVSSLSPAMADTVVTVGAMGDSWSDEQSLFDAQAAGLYSWTEILVRSGKASMGPLRNFSSPDTRKGPGGSYENNFALAGATVDSLLGDGSPLYTGSQCGSPVGSWVWGGFRQAAIDRKFEYANLFIGGNNFLRESIYRVNNVPIGPNTFALFPPNPTTIAKLTEIWNDYLEGLNIATGGSGNNVKMVVGTMPDLGSIPVVVWDSFNFTPDQRNNIRQHIILFNDQVRMLAAQRNYALIDFWAWWEDLRARRVVNIGGLDIAVVVPGNGSNLADLNNVFLADGLHPAPIGACMVANLFLEAIRDHYGAPVSPISPAEMLRLSNLSPPVGPPTATPSPSPTEVPTLPASATPTPTVTETPSATPTETPSGTPTSSPSPTATPRPHVMLAGFMQTQLTTEEGGVLTILALTGDATRLQLGAGEEYTMTLPYLGDPAEGVFQLGNIAFGPGVSPSKHVLHLRPLHGSATGRPWPYLWVEE